VGYSTEFTGEVTVTPPLNAFEVVYFRRFTDTRRMFRLNGPYYTGTGLCGQDHEPDIQDYNRPGPEQPGLWCKWEPSDDGTVIRWDGGEKFYDSEEWMRYLIDTFLKPGVTLAAELKSPMGVDGRYYAPEFSYFTFDHVVNGVIEAQGEDPGDHWWLVVEGNVVRVQETEAPVITTPTIVTSYVVKGELEG
jgi:hypothetical protein